MIDRCNAEYRVHCVHVHYPFSVNTLLIYDTCAFISFGGYESLVNEDEKAYFKSNSLDSFDEIIMRKKVDKCKSISGIT